MPHYGTVFESEKIVNQDFKITVENPMIIIGRETFDQDLVELRE
jgi:dihydrofolate reductase